MKDHLLGELGRDTAQSLRLLLEPKFTAQLGFRVASAGFGHADLAGRVGDKVGDDLNGVHFDLAAVGVVVGNQLLAGLVVLAGSDNDRVLESIDDDLRIDALRLTQIFDLSKKTLHH